MNFVFYHPYCLRTAEQNLSSHNASDCSAVQKSPQKMPITKKIWLNKWMTELFMRTFTSSFSSAQASKPVSHSAGWWLGNLLTSGRSIPMSMEMLPPFSFLIRHSPVTSSQNLSFLWNENHISCEAVWHSRFSTKSYKMWVCIVVHVEHQVVQEGTYVSLLAFQESLFLLQCPPLLLFAQQTAGH